MPWKVGRSISSPSVTRLLQQQNEPQGLLWFASCILTLEKRNWITNMLFSGGSQAVSDRWLMSKLLVGFFCLPCPGSDWPSCPGPVVLTQTHAWRRPTDSLKWPSFGQYYLYMQSNLIVTLFSSMINQWFPSSEFKERSVSYWKEHLCSFSDMTCSIL